MKLKDLVFLKEQNETGGRTTKVQKLKMSDIEDEVTINQKVGSCMDSGNIDKCLNDVTISWGNESHTVDFEFENVIDDHGNEGVDAEFIANSKDKKWQFILDVSGAMGIEDGSCNPCIQDYDWEELIIQSHPDDESHLDPEDRSDQDDVDEFNQIRRDAYMEEDIDEGTCGYTQTVNGRKLKTPGGTRGPKPLNERFQQLAGIKPLYINEQGFDDRLKAAGGFSDEEFEDITSRDIESPFPGTDDSSPHSDGIRRASNLIDELRQNYRSMSDEEIDSFSKEMIEHFLDNTTAQAAAKIWFSKKEI